MHKFSHLLLAALIGLSLDQPTSAAPAPKASGKERLVLMPLRVSEADKELQGAMEAALVEGLEHRHEVFSGEQVQQKTRQVFDKESKSAKRDCDETRCMQDIAEAFQAELIATADVTRRADGYFLTLTVRNIFDDKVVFSKSTPCPGCTTYQVVDKLKELAAGEMATASTPVNLAPPPSLAALGQKVDATDPESMTWAEAVKDNTVGSYNQYLKQYPKGRYIALAKMKASRADIGVVMVQIPGKNYEIGKFEVTQAQWKIIMGNNPSYFSPEKESGGGDNWPVEDVSWNNVQEFLEKLNARTGKQYRLPTEAEWEYACYGGKKTKYCGGDDPNLVAWHWGNSKDTAHPVGQKRANGYGLYDMSGNVWEWTQDWYDNSQQEHVLRGGSWFSKPLEHPEYRLGGVPDQRFRFHGFRLARTLP